MSHDDVLFGFRLRLFSLASEIGVRPACRRWACTTRPITAGSAGSSAGTWKHCESGSGARRGCRTSWDRISSSASSPSPSPTLASVPRVSPPSFAVSAGAGSASPRTASGGCCAGTGSTPAASASRSSPATPPATSESLPGLSPSGTSRPPGPASSSDSTASTSVARRGRRAPSGSTGGGDHGQRLRVPSARLHRHARPALRGAAAHPRRQAADERKRRAPAADDPRGVLAALQRDLKLYLGYYNFDRAHTGRLTKGRVPGEIVYGARKVRPR